MDSIPKTFDMKATPNEDSLKKPSILLEI